METSSKYSIPYSDFLHARCWDDQCAVYHAESGDTHVLNKVDVDILLIINEKPLAAKDLSVEFECVFGSNAGQYIQALLSNLSGLGLIQTVNAESAN